MKLTHVVSSPHRHIQSQALQVVQAQQPPPLHTISRSFSQDHDDLQSPIDPHSALTTPETLYALKHPPTLSRSRDDRGDRDAVGGDSGSVYSRLPLHAAVSLQSLPPLRGEGGMLI